MFVIPAPMAGLTDFAFRQILCECGSPEVWTEMISCTALYMGSAKTQAMLRCADRKVYQVVQLFGADPKHFYEVIRSGVLSGYDEININMGCPASKIVKNGSGCVLMRDIGKARDIISACAAAVKESKQKLSVKMRLGQDHINAAEIAGMCESLGIDRIIVHGRLGADGYSGNSNYNEIAKVVSAVNIPVFANGDIRDHESAMRCLEITKAAGVMMGRALLGAPWKIKLNRDTSISKMKEIIKRHAELHEGSFGELKKHFLYYCSSLNAAKNTKRAVAAAKSINEIFRLLEI
jgi:tRNA-dihydrouridine synthase B